MLLPPFALPVMLCATWFRKEQRFDFAWDPEEPPELAITMSRR